MLPTQVPGMFTAPTVPLGNFATLSTRGFANENEYSDGYNSSLMIWNAGFGHRVAEVFEMHKAAICEYCVSDQVRGCS